MVSYRKSVILLSTAVSAHVAGAHKIPKNLDKEKFAAKLKQLRIDQGELIAKGEHLKMSPGSGTGNIIPGSTTDPDAFLDGHEFIGPGDSDVRGPCPFINVMANHGFINRNGRDVPAFLIPELATILFDLPSEGFLPIVNLSIFDGQTVTLPNGETLLDIDRLWDRPGEERDVSMIFPNPGKMLNEENLFRDASEGFPTNNDEVFVDFRYAINQDQLDDLLARAENGILTQTHHNEFLHDRLIESLESEPGYEFTRYSEEDIATSTNQYLLPVLILGEDVSDFTFAPAEHINGLWSQFRFPDGYAPRSVRHGDDFDAAFYQSQREMFQATNEATVLEILEESVQKRANAARAKLQALKDEEAVQKAAMKKAAKKAMKNLRVSK